MKRWISLTVTLAFLAGCNGIGSGGSRFVPGTPTSDSATGAGPAAASVNGRRHKVAVRVRMRIPRRHRHENLRPVHPSTISSQTQSVSFTINGGAPQVFNATPSSPGCSIGVTGTTCTFTVSALPGADTFVVKTYNATGGGGVVLNYGTAVINIVAGKNNSANVSLGPVVSTTADNGIGSLRYAIGSTNPGDTIMFLLPAGSVITLNTPLTPASSISIAGPGVTAGVRHRADRNGLHGNTTFSGVTISGNNTTQVFVINSGITITISGLILTAGKATVPNQPGGDVYNAGTLALANDAITGGTSIVASPFIAHNRVHAAPRHGHPKPALQPHCATTYNYGGGLYNHGTVTITGTTFDSNVVQSSISSCLYGYGGGIYNDQFGQLTATGSTFSNNSGYYGGAVYNDSGNGEASFASDAFTGNTTCNATSGCPTAGCTPTSCTTYAEGYGGAIYDASGPGITVSASTFSNNVAGGGPNSYGYGGGLYLDTGAPVVTGSTFTDNVAGGGSADCSYGYGGAIAAYENLQSSGNTFTNNVAGGDDYGYGGALYMSASLSSSGDSYSGNSAAGAGSPCTTSAYGYGGAAYEDSTYPMDFANDTFTGNTATGNEYAYGGGLYFDGGGTISGSTFTSNSAVGTGVAGSTTYPYAYGGAVYNSSGTVKASGSTFTSNTATGLGPRGEDAYGGAVYGSDDFHSTGNTYTSNSAVLPGFYTSGYSYGGAIYASSNFSSNGDTFKSNSGSSSYYGYGGAVYAGSTTSISNATFTSNSMTAPYSYAGALYIDSSGSQVTNSTFTSNSVGLAGQQAYGGAIYDNSGVTLSGSTLTGNTAIIAGGGMYSDSTDTIAGSTISGNSVSQGGNGYGGGGIFADSTTIMNSTISGNTVTVAALYSGGGGVYNDGNMTISGSTIAGNSVLGSIGSSGGGGIYSYSSGTIYNSTITGNSSGIDGGGIEQFSSSPLELYNVTVFQNKATGNGGNLYNAYSTYLVNTIAGGGTAASGSDVYNLSGATLNSGDYNIFQTAIAGSGSVTGTTTHNLIADPKLLPLSNNGGPTQTNADQAGSPGVAYIPFAGSNCGAATGNNVDQRNFTRGAGGLCDAGAFELGGVPSSIRVHHPAARGTGHKHHHHPRPLHRRHAN